MTKKKFHLNKLVTKTFITRTFYGRDYMTNNVSSSYVLGDEIRIFCDEKCSSS